MLISFLANAVKSLLLAVVDGREIATFGRVTPDNQCFARAPRRAAREKARKAWLIPPRARDVERSDEISIREQEKVKQSVTNPPPRRTM